MYFACSSSETAAPLFHSRSRLYPIYPDSYEYSRHSTTRRRLNAGTQTLSRSQHRSRVPGKHKHGSCRRKMPKGRHSYARRAEDRYPLNNEPRTMNGRRNPRPTALDPSRERGRRAAAIAVTVDRSLREDPDPRSAIERGRAAKDTVRIITARAGKQGEQTRGADVPRTQPDAPSPAEHAEHALPSRRMDFIVDFKANSRPARNQ